MAERILLVEDEEKLARMVELELQYEGYEVEKAFDGRAGLDRALSGEFDLVLLDIMLPALSGMEVLRRLRRESAMPVIMLTARDTVVDKVSGLDMGADDYITKPFNPLELVARVKTQLRRYERYNHPLPAGVQSSSDAEPERDSRIDIRGLTIDRDSHKCSLNGSTLSLTPREFSILWYLCENKGRVISSEELFEQVWGEKFLDNNNTVMAHIGRLREKMKDSGRRPKYIKTVWGVGYQIE